MVAKIKVAEEILSKYQLQAMKNNKFSFDKNKNNIPNLSNKRKYKIPYQNLKLYLNLGFKK